MPKPKTSPGLTIIILSYNVRSLLADCLRSIIRTRRRTDKWQIVVVDNQSTDDSVVFVRRHFPQVKLIVNSANLGFSAGNNVALRQVTTPFTLLLNPDTVVYPATIRTVLEYMAARPEVGAATCRVELPDGSLDYSCHRRFPDPMNSFVYFFTGLGKRSTYAFSEIPSGIHEIDSLTGAFALIRTQIGQQLAWLDEDYYWNGEDLDFCFRLKQAGYKVMYLPQVKIAHFKGSSSGLYVTGKQRAGQASRLRSVNSGIDAMRTYYRKHLSGRYPWLFNRFVNLGISVLRLYRLVKVRIS